MKTIFFVLLILCCHSCVLQGLNAEEVIYLSAADTDMTPVVRKAIEVADSDDVKIVFEKGTYYFRPDYAFEKDCAITNHGNGRKRIAFPFRDLSSIEIEGNGSELIFHGQMMPFLFENCGRVRARDITIDWDIPFTFLGEVVACNPTEQWRDIRPMTDGFSWKLHDGQLHFPDVDGFSYPYLGSTLAFDAKERRVAHGALDLESRPRLVEKRAGGVLRFYEGLRKYPAVGTLLSSKGDREHDRYAPAIHVKSSENIHFENVIIHHALGMGFLMERSDTATLTGCGVHLRKGTNRVISSTADATHFCNCRGEILVENCRFENMLDDGTNVHGTYVSVDEVIDTHTVRVKLMHFEQSGFEFASVGDEIWFVHQPDPRRESVNEVASITPINGQFVQLTFAKPLPRDLVPGDVLENKTWNPTFTMRGCTVRNHRARNIVLKTPLKTVVENNEFSSMMSSIFFRGETYFWFESGAVNDVLIRNNRFQYCAYSAMEHAVLTITPRLGKTFDQDVRYDRNIRFENNTVETFDNRIVWADRVDGLVISGNTIRQSGDAESLHPTAAAFDFTNCRNVRVVNNTYEGEHSPRFEVDAITEKTLVAEDNQGF